MKIQNSNKYEEIKTRKKKKTSHQMRKMRMEIDRKRGVNRSGAITVLVAIKIIKRTVSGEEGSGCLLRLPL